MMERMEVYTEIDGWFNKPDGRFIPTRHMIIKNKIRNRRKKNDKFRKAKKY